MPEPADAVRGFDPDDLDGSIDRLNRASFAPPSSVRSLAPLLEEPEPNQRWAAVYLAALMVKEDTADVLRPALEDPVLPLRVTATGALASVGVVESLPVLIEALGSEEELWYSDPPRPAADLAREALEAYTGEAFPSPEQWAVWWDDVHGSLRWDGERFVAE